jgi:hypothetical protein
MTFDLSSWRAFHDRINPHALLRPDEVEARYAERALAPWRDIADQIVESSDPSSVRVIFAGARGAGKTTELIRLYADLARDASEYVPMYVDLGPALQEAGGTLPILALAAAVIRRAGDDWQAPAVPPERDAVSAALVRLGAASTTFAELVPVVASVASWLHQPNGGLLETAGTVDWTGIASVAGRLRSVLAGPVGPERRPDAEQLVVAVRAEIDRLREASGGRTPVLLLDGVDKLRSREEVHAALADADLLLALPCAFVLSGPIQLRRDRRFAGGVLTGNFTTVTLHNVPVVRREGGRVVPDDGGVAVLDDLLRRRLDGPVAMFRDAFPPEVVRAAALASSGVVREFLELIQRTGREMRRSNSDVATLDHVDAAIKKRRHDFQASLDGRDWQVLEAIYRTGQLVTEDADELLFTNLIACYPNGDVWFRPSEILVPYIERELASRAGTDDAR